MSDVISLKENGPELWRGVFPIPDASSHKYTRGAVLIRGGAVMTGASRLAARAAQRVGAGLVTLASPVQAVPVCAQNLESVIVRPCDHLDEWKSLLSAPHHPTILMGPGLGTGKEEDVVWALACRRATVLDADALTCFEGQQWRLFSALHEACVLTPHEGEFARLFGAIGEDRYGAARRAAQIAGCIVVLKGAETLIAAPDGSVVVNRHAPPWLATAGAGDVLAGMIAGLLTQGMSPLMAAAAAVWIHGECAMRCGLGLIAEDLVERIPVVLQGSFCLEPARPVVGLGVVARRGGRVLFGLRKSKHGHQTWGLAGGHLECGESWEECARRELREETGLEMGAVRFLGATNDFYPDGKHYVTLFMGGDCLTGDVEMKEPDKFERWEWIGKDDVPAPLMLSLQNFVDSGVDLFAAGDGAQAR